jgi:hypothetical protein
LGPKNGKKCQKVLFFLTYSDPLFPKNRKIN